MVLPITQAFLRFFGCLDLNGNGRYEKGECGRPSWSGTSVFFADRLFEDLDKIAPQTGNAFSTTDVDRFFSGYGADKLNSYYPTRTFSFPPQAACLNVSVLSTAATTRWRQDVKDDAMRSVLDEYRLSPDLISNAGGRALHLSSDRCGSGKPLLIIVADEDHFSPRAFRLTYELFSGLLAWCGNFVVAKEVVDAGPVIDDAYILELIEEVDLAFSISETINISLSAGMNLESIRQEFGDDQSFRAGMYLYEKRVLRPANAGIIPFIEAHPDFRDALGEVYWSAKLSHAAKGNGMNIFNIEFQTPPMHERVKNPGKFSPLCDSGMNDYLKKYNDPIRRLKSYYKDLKEGERRPEDTEACPKSPGLMDRRVLDMEEHIALGSRERSEIQAINLLGLAPVVGEGGVVVAHMGSDHVGDEIPLLTNVFSILVIK